MFKNTFYAALLVIISWGSYQLSHPNNTPSDLFYDGLFLENITEHIDRMTRGEHAVGGHFHDDVQRYVIKQLQTSGLDVVKHRSTNFNPRSKTSAPIRNIMATRPGKNPDAPALLLMSHYDSAPFSAGGAADAASGVAIILDVMRKLHVTKAEHENDIMVLITDAEELGLLGARAFVTEQLKNHSIGLAINLEARGAAGPSIMVPETVQGNQAVIKGYQNANVPLPFANSLAYELYKALPNDTDLTPIREMGQINGIFLAFIDDFYFYHTAGDNLQNLSLDSLAHQAIQFLSLVEYFADQDLSQMASENSLVYFSLSQIGLVTYPTNVNWLLWLAGLVLLVWGWSHRKANTGIKWMATAKSLVIGVVVTFGVLRLFLLLLAWLFPGHQDMLHGFPYDGHIIMLGSLSFAVLCGLWVMSRYAPDASITLLIWAALLGWVCVDFPGAGFLVWPWLGGCLLFLIDSKWSKIGAQLTPVIAVLSTLLMSLLIVILPITMGIKSLPLTGVLVVLLLNLWPGLASRLPKHWSATLVPLLPLAILVGYLLYIDSDTKSRPLPTSLSYLYDFDQEKAYLYHYDHKAHPWHEAFFKEPLSSGDRSAFIRTYHQPSRQITNAEPLATLQPADIKVTKPLKQRNDGLSLDIDIIAGPEARILDIYTESAITIHRLVINGRVTDIPKPWRLEAGKKVLTHYFNGQKQVPIQMVTDAGTVLEWQVLIHTPDLLSRAELAIPERPENQMPKPFIRTDNVVTVQSVTFDPNQQ